MITGDFGPIDLGLLIISYATASPLLAYATARATLADRYWIAGALVVVMLGGWCALVTMAVRMLA